MKNRKQIITLLVLLGVFLLLWSVCNISSISGAVSAALSVVVPIIAGLCIAFILNIPLRIIERLWIKWFTAKYKGLRRAVSIVLCLLLLAAILGLILGLIIPQIFVSIRDKVVPRIPFYIEELYTWYGMLETWLGKFSIYLPPLNISPAQIMNVVKSIVLTHGQVILGQSVGIAKAVFSGIIKAVVAFVIAIYVLAQKEKLGRQAKKVLYGIFSEKNTERILTMLRLTEKTFSNFVTGQLTEAVILGSLCFVGMLIFRMPYSLIVSVLVGVTALIPIFGAFIGTGVGAVIILFESPIKAIWFLVFILVLQQIEGNLIYPKVVGTQVGLPGLWVIIAVTVGSEFGIVGMLIAVPLMSLIYTVTRQVINAKLKDKGIDGIFEELEPEKKPQRQKKKSKSKKKDIPASK